MEYEAQLLEIAFKAAKNSYSPYSHFKVGAALLTSDYKVFTGCNVENASFSLTNCAERAAFSRAISEGYRNFAAIAIVGYNNEEDKDNPCFPCGACRQVMAELCDENFRIILTNRVYNIMELFPHPFNLK